MSIQLKPLNEQVMVITGASSGIGLSTARAAAQAGAKLVLTARSEDTLATTVEQIKGSGGEAIYVVADITDRAQIDKVTQAALAEFGRIDTWVNDAGLGLYGKVDEIPDADNRALFETNFWGIVNGTFSVLPYLRENGGALINLGSEVSEAVVPWQVMYGATKHAIKGFTDGLRVELEVEEAPVSVTLIQPTAVNTPFPQHAPNTMNKEPKLPDPMIDPQQVTDAILHAAVHGGRDVKVGLMSKLNTFAHDNLGGLADKMSVGQANRQNYEEEPRHPEGILHEVGDSGHVHGSGGKTEE